MADYSLTEEIRGEQESYADDSLYNIISYGTDIMISQLVEMYKNGDIEKPELQRNYVWQKTEASRFIDSILLGLPVPGIFLARARNNKLLIVDGYQRIMTVYDYIRGIFGGDKKVFKLSSKGNIYRAWKGKAYSELPEESQRAIRTYSIHATIFEQKHPNDDSSMYQIFERINTGGRVLKPQEIRNCIYHGSFNDMLSKLNHYGVWREVLGSHELDFRMADAELILRFFAFIDLPQRKESKQQQINLVKYLNTYMNDNKNISADEAERLQSQFISIISSLYKQIGFHLFRTAKNKGGRITWAKKINPVVFDAVCFASYMYGNDNLPDLSLAERYTSLVLDEEFVSVTRQRTTDIANIRRRVEIAIKFLYK